MEGGLGFKTFRAFNESLLAEQGWRIISNPDSLLSRCLKARSNYSGSSCWNQNVINQIFLPFEAQQIIQIPIARIGGGDQLTWGPGRRGEFSVKSAYHCIKKWEISTQVQNSDYAATDEVWKKLWSLKTLPKYVHLAWRILNNGIAVKNRLHERGVQCDTSCPRCEGETEDIDHVFKSCPWAKMVWFSSLPNVNFDNVHDSFVSWLSEVIKSAPVEVVTHTLSLYYGSWWARNKCCFEGKTIQPAEIVRKAWHIIEDFQSTLNSQNSQRINVASSSYPTQTCWIAPPPACYKINVDVAGPLDGFWGIGVVVRDNVGCIYAAATWKLQGLPEVDTTEAIGMHHALTFAQEMGFLNFHAETDSLHVVLAMNSRKVNHSYFGRIILDCIEMSNCFNDFHVKREGNKVAHKLAKFALANLDSVWLEEIPPCIALEFRGSL